LLKIVTDFAKNYSNGREEIKKKKERKTIRKDIYVGELFFFEMNLQDSVSLVYKDKG